MQPLKIFRLHTKVDMASARISQNVSYPLSSVEVRLMVLRVDLWRYHHHGHCISSRQSSSHQFVETVLTGIFSFFITSVHGPNSLHIVKSSHASTCVCKLCTQQIIKLQCSVNICIRADQYNAKWMAPTTINYQENSRNLTSINS